MSQYQLFDIRQEWEEHWKGMPEFNQDNLMPWQTMKVHFRCKEDRESFAELLEQKITPLTKYVWYPKAEFNVRINERYKTDQHDQPKYPIYVISKGRWDSRLTIKALEQIRVNYRVVIEPQEYEQYASVIDKDKLLVLPFSNLGQGSIPARNWVWEHSIQEGHSRHWILDDNISCFMRLNNNTKTRVDSGVTFKIIEDFVDRYKNVDMAGMNYQWLAKQRQLIPPIYINHRIYSCILLNNQCEFRWRGRYNEDTDLSLRILKSGRCTVLFNAFLADKISTMIMKGGNTDELYKDDGRLKMAESLREQHPDVTKVVWKWGRWQHHVDYRGFKKNKLKLKDNISVDQNADEYGMFIKDINQEEMSA